MVAVEGALVLLVLGKFLAADSPTARMPPQVVEFRVVEFKTTLVIHDDVPACL